MSNRRTLLRTALLCLALPAVALLPAAATAAEVIVFGGTGQLGSEVVRALLAAGHEVTVFRRASSDLSRLQGMKVNTAVGDATLDRDVQAAFATKRYDVAVNALAKGRNDPAGFYASTQRAITAAAKATGVKQVILHSSVGAGESRAIYPEANWARLKDVLLAKDVGERELIASGVPYTILRNAVLRDDASGGRDQAELTTDQRRFGGVTRRGLGRLTAGCTLKAECLNRIYHAIDPLVPVPQR